MPLTLKLESLLGKWSGTNRLWLSPEEDAYESKSTAQVASVAQGQFITVSYTWAIENEAHDGLLVFPSGIEEASTRSVWLDSWHTRNEMMLLDGRNDDGRIVSLQGSYPAPPEPDWHWRIEIRANESTPLEMRMINISPTGQEALAVLAQYQRIEPA